MFLAESLTLNGAWIAIAGGLLAILLGVIKVLDRLYLEPRMMQRRVNGGGSKVCQFQHEVLGKTSDRIEGAVGKLIEAQTDLSLAITGLASANRNEMEISRMRHQEIMKALELVERKLEQMNGAH